MGGRGQEERRAESAQEKAEYQSRTEWRCAKYSRAHERHLAVKYQSTITRLGIWRLELASAISSNLRRHHSAKHWFQKSERVYLMRFELIHAWTIISGLLLQGAFHSRSTFFGHSPRRLDPSLVQ